MKQRMKELFCVILGVCLVVSSVVLVNAAEFETKSSKGKVNVVNLSDEVKPFYVASCTMYGKHKMRPRGYVVVKNKETSDEIWGGQLFVCDCGHILAIRKGYTRGCEIGDFYRGWVSQYEVDHIVMPSAVYVNPSELEYTHKTYLEGYEFIH